MSEPKPLILPYATPPADNRFAKMPIVLIVLLAMVVPGLSSSLIRGSAKRCICLFPIIPLAFVFFGPIWGEVLFRRSSLSEAGLYPFILTCAVVEIVSVSLAIIDAEKRRKQGHGETRG